MVGIPGNDRRDIQASLEGDEQAYARLVERHQDLVAAYMWRFSRDKAVCEELVHDVFVEVYLSLRTYSGKAPFSHWIRKIATRVGYRHWKRISKERSHPSVPLEAWEALQVPGGEVPGPKIAAGHVRDLLAQLPPRDQLVLTLLYLEECTVQEAAQLTGWSRTMVKVQAHRARKKLRNLLEKSTRS